MISLFSAVTNMEACSIACGACFLTLWSIALLHAEHASSPSRASLCIMRNMLPPPTEWCSERKNLYSLLPVTYYLLPITFYLLPIKKETIKYIIQLIVAILTAILTTLGVVSCL